MDCSCFTLNDQNFAARSSLICRCVQCRLGTLLETECTYPDRIEMGRFSRVIQIQSIQPTSQHFIPMARAEFSGISFVA